MKKIQKQILRCLKNYYLEYASPLRVIEISEQLQLDGRDILVNVQLLETDDYVLKKNELPSRPLYDDYIITQKGIESLKLPLKKIILCGISLIVAIVSIMTGLKELGIF